MKAQNIRLTDLLVGPKQRNVPIFRHDYIWGIEHYLRRLNDQVFVGSSEIYEFHFVGSLVYFEADAIPAQFARLLLVERHRRLTSVVILFLAIPTCLACLDVIFRQAHFRFSDLVLRFMGDKLIVAAGLNDRREC